MNKVSLVNALKSIQRKTSKHAPAIAIGVGLACFGTAIFSGIKETPKAIRLIEEKKKELDLAEDEKVPPVDVFKAVWKCYVPMALSFTAGATCILGAHKINGKRNAALAAAYQISETALREYKNKVIETIGEKKEEAIRHEVVKDKVAKNPPASTQVFITERGKTLCYDCCTDRYFESDLEAIRKIVNQLNFQLQQEHFISLNEFYYEVGLPNCDLGDMLGWNIDDGLIELEFTSMMTPDDRPCIAFTFSVAPRYEYNI